MIRNYALRIVFAGCEMLGFFVILLIILTGIIMVTRKCVGVLWDNPRKKLAQRVVLYTDIFLVFGMVFGYTVGHGSLWAGGVLHIATILFMGQLIFDVITLLFLLIQWGRRKILNAPQDEGRRRFLKGAAILPVGAAAISLYGGLVEKNAMVVRHFDVPVENIPDDIKGFSIVQLSDIHLGPFMGLEDLDRLLQQASGLQGDILAITGDLFDDRKINAKAAKMVDSYVDHFKYGIVYCRGNHEYFRGIQAIDMALAKTRIQYLVNANTFITGTELPIYVAGVDYPIKRDEFQFLQEAYTDLALKDIPDKSVKILLAHHPDFFDSAAKYGTDLVLAGHTHGGQLGVLGVPVVPPLFKYMRGMYKVENTLGYVHSGNGSWFPFRLGCPPEIAVFTLTDQGDRDTGDK